MLTCSPILPTIPWTLNNFFPVGWGHPKKGADENYFPSHAALFHQLVVRGGQIELKFVWSVWHSNVICLNNCTKLAQIILNTASNSCSNLQIKNHICVSLCVGKIMQEYLTIPYNWLHLFIFSDMVCTFEGRSLKKLQRVVLKFSFPFTKLAIWIVLMKPFEYNQFITQW